MKRTSSAPASDLPNKRAKTATAAEGFARCQIVAGSYERLLYGLNAEYAGSELQLQPIFSFPAHASCVKTVAASPPAAGSSKRWLVTGSTEDNIKVWDLKRRKEVGDLIVHEAATTAIKFIDSKLLLTASVDSTINLLRTKDWAVLRTLKGHKGRVNDVDLHPKGRIALSVGQDRTLRFWDIVGNTNSVTGKGGSSSTKLGQEGDVVRWNTDGSLFGILCAREMRLYSTNMELKRVLDSKSRFHDLRFLKHASFPEDELLLLACDDGKCRIYLVSKLLGSANDLDGPVAELGGHKNRIRSLEIVTLRKEDKPVLHAITVSTDGFIHIYALDDLTTLKTIAPLARWDTKGSRLTCLTVAGYNDADATTTQAQQAEASDSDSDDSDFGLDGAAESSEEDGSEVNEAELAALEELAALQEEAARDSESDEEEEEEAEEWGGIGA